MGCDDFVELDGGLGVPEYAMLNASDKHLHDGGSRAEIHVRHPHWNDIAASVLVPLERRGKPAIDYAIELCGFGCGVRHPPDLTTPATDMSAARPQLALRK